ncbi:MAG: SusE domain-containing protein [Flavobacterium sp.]|nr:SusE domain-containing protein [Flavobacterium sp.]
MKQILKLISFSLLFAVAFTACKKDENKIFAISGTNPVLTASSTAPLVLNVLNQNNTAISFSWTNPNYQFSTGVSSQDVSYALQFDTTGANFTNPKLQTKSISKDLAVTLTVKELNTILLSMGLLEGKAQNIEIRLVASLSSSAIPLPSNVIKIVITPYLDVAIPLPTTGELFITGDACASGWTNTPPVAQKCTKIDNTTYKITMSFTSGKFYKFLTNQGFWQPQYGVKIASGGTASGGKLGLNNNMAPYNSDPDAIPTPSSSGNYTITLNFKTGDYSVQ